MRYRRVEQLVLVIGGATVLAGVAMWTPFGSPVTSSELVAQALLFGVLLASAKGGRRAGFAAAVVASVAYVVLRLPDLSAEGLTMTEVLVLATRMLSFGLIGIVGGELFSRLRYSLTRLEGHSALDEWSLVYNQPFVHAELERARSRHGRYGEPLSVIVITVSGSVLSGVRPSRQRAIVRGLADAIRSSVRMVDAVARLEDGRFVVVLPQTAREGGLVVRDRLSEVVCKAAGAREEAVGARCLGLPEDAQALGAFIASIAPAEQAAQLPESGSYSSEDGSTRMPEAVRTASAPSSSTLNTSTAASPEGSTKQ